MARRRQLRSVVGAGRLVLLGGGVSEDVSYDVYRDRVEPRPNIGSVQEGAEARSWWRGVFGG